MKRWVLGALLIVGFAAGLIAFAPLETALRISGADKHGLRWERVEGSVLEGRVAGIVVGQTDYGSADLKLVPGALALGSLRYSIDWTSAHGRGSGDLSVGLGNRITVSDFDVDLDLLQLEQAARWIQQSGGRVQFVGQTIQFHGQRCHKAAGSVRSDVLERNREVLGTGWSEMRGDLRCENGELVVPLDSASSSGTQFRAQLRVAPGSPGRFEARVSGLIPRELLFALPIAGFAPDGREFVYSYSPVERGEPT